MRSAILEAAASLFADSGVDAVSLREVALKADVNRALIGRYIGDREALIAAAFAHASDELERSLREQPLALQGFESDTPMGRWVRIAASMAIGGHVMHPTVESNPVTALAMVLQSVYGIGDEAARLRAAQIAAAGLGWRIFEDYLVEAAGLEEVPLDDLRLELVRSARRLGSTAYPSPPDPVRIDQQRGRTPRRKATRDLRP